MGGSGVESAPAGVQLIDTEAEARALASRLVQRDRSRPTVVLTVAGEQTEPFGDPYELAEAVGGLAEVVLVRSREASWAFSRDMPPDTSVYGGAGRAYPVGHDWVIDPRLSRVRFAYSRQAGPRLTEQLVNDAMVAAMAAGLLTPVGGPGLRHRSGKVAGVIGSRAMVRLDDGTLATVWEESTVPGVALDRVLSRNQSVHGAYDPESRRMDLRGGLLHLDATSARAAVLDGWTVGDVVLAEVVDVAEDLVRMRLLPGLVVAVDRLAVTSNPADALAEFFTVGEVVRARITGNEPLHLRLDDIDDTDEPRPALSLLPGGPPWLVPAEPASVVVAPRPIVPERVAPVAVHAEAAPRRPSPLDLAPRSRGVAAASGGPGDDSLDQERKRVAGLSNELAVERRNRQSLSAELAEVRAHAARQEAELARMDRELERLRTRHREAALTRQSLVRRLKAGPARPEDGTDTPAFLDPEQQFRYEVGNEWARRIPAPEKDRKPLADYTLHHGFLTTLGELEGVSRAKVVAVVVEILTDQVQHLAGRELHRLRAGNAGSRYLTRPEGGSCWRVALQQNSAGARRLHYWRTENRYEFSRVAVHDDFRS